jgi:hypothetical protein
MSDQGSGITVDHIDSGMEVGTNEREDCKRFWDQDVPYMVFDSCLDPIAAILKLNPDDHEDYAMRTAQLFAAAPELLAACRAVMMNIDRLTEIWGPEGVTRTVRDTLKRAIDKAEGKY